MKNNEVARAFFGSVGRLKATGGYTPEPERIRQAFVRESSVIHLACRGCGTIGELTEKGLKICLDDEKIPYPDLIESGMYLESDGCPACDGIDGNFKLKKL